MRAHRHSGEMSGRSRVQQHTGWLLECALLKSHLTAWEEGQTQQLVAAQLLQLMASQLLQLCDQVVKDP